MKLLVIAAILAGTSAPARAGKYFGLPDADPLTSPYHRLVRASDHGLQLAVVDSVGASRHQPGIELAWLRTRFEDGFPLFARPRVKSGIALAYHFDRSFQLRGPAGLGLGPVGIALASVYERRPGSDAFGLSAELELRHRFGPSYQARSIGAFVRGDVLFSNRALHEDRISIGVFAMMDLWDGIE